MRLLSLALLLTASCGGGQIQNLPLQWRAADLAPRPSPSVAQALASIPLAYGLRDVRPDPTAVGAYEADGWVVRTSDNVGQYCTSRLGDILAHAGARLAEPPTTALEVELLEYRVVEANVFNGSVSLRVIVRHGGAEAWSKTYVGKSKRWGRSHSPDNFNEALSNALADAATHLVQDDEFAHALMPEQQPPPAAYPGGPAGG